MITTLLPQTQGNYNNWTLGAGASKPIAVQVQDGDTGYIYAATAVRESFAHQGLAAWVYGITSHQITNRSKSPTGGGGGNWPQINNFTRYGGADTDGGFNALTAAYANYSDTDLGGASPTRAVINATEIGVWLTSVAYGNAYTTRLDWDITHSVAARGFVCIIGQWLGPLVAVGLAEMRRLATELHRRSGALITPDEYMAAWRELREARHRRYHVRPAAVRGGAVW